MSLAGLLVLNALTGANHTDTGARQDNHLLGPVVQCNAKGHSARTGRDNLVRGPPGRSSPLLACLRGYTRPRSRLPGFGLAPLARPASGRASPLLERRSQANRAHGAMAAGLR